MWFASRSRLPGWRLPARWMMQRRFRLHRSSDIQRVRRTGKSYAHPLVVLVAARNEEGGRRVAVSISRSVGGAVERNFIRRRIRHVVRGFLPALSDGWDFLIIARPGARQAEFAELADAVRSLFSRAGVLNADPGHPGRPR
jgi:ribonuclease P protein component